MLLRSLFCLWATLLLSGSLCAQAWQLPETFSPATFRQTVTTKLSQELQASLDALVDPEAPAPAYLFGVPFGGGGSYTKLPMWIERYRRLSGRDSLGRHDLHAWTQARLMAAAEDPGRFFPQLSIARAVLLLSEGEKLAESAYGQALTPAEYDRLQAGLQIRRSYDPADTTKGWENEEVGGRPNNYYGVALLLAAHCFRLGLDPDTALLDALFARNLAILERSHGYLDDHKRYEGAFDRYTFEYLRFLWQAAEMTGRPAVLAQLKPWMQQSAQLWWDLYDSEVGHSAHYGRSRMNAWDDVFEQTAFYAQHPELSPAPLPELAAAFSRAWNVYFSTQYDHDRHLNRIYAPGRAPNGYAGEDRIWDYSTGTLSKLCISAAELLQALEAAGVAEVKARPELPPVDRFHRFRPDARNFGLWMYRDAATHFVLPVVGNGFGSEYLPRPYGLPALGVPVRENGPWLCPQVTLPDGETLMWSHGADSVWQPGPGQLALRWTHPNDKRGRPQDIGLAVEALWQWKHGRLQVEWTFAATREVRLASWEMVVPVTAGQYEPATGRLSGEAGSFRVAVTVDWLTEQAVYAPPAGAWEGRGAFTGLPLHLRYRAESVSWEEGEQQRIGWGMGEE